MTLLGALLTGTTLALLAATAHALVRTTALAGRSERFAAYLIVAAAELVLVAELLSLIGAFTLLAGLIMLMLAAAGAIAISRRVSPYEWRGPRESIRAWLDLLKPLAAEFKPPRSATLAAILLVVILGVEFVLAIAIAPNTWDSLTYHLTRAAYWIQFHSIEQFQNATNRQAVFPINAEVIQAWALMLAKGDRTVQLVQWVAQLGALAVIFAFTRRLGYSRRDGIFTMAIGASLPVMVGESMSSQNDLTFAFFALAALLFLTISLRGGPRSAAIFFAVAFGLAVGTKSVTLVLVPVYAVVALVLCGKDWRLLIRPLVAALIAVLVLGSFNYVQNIAEHGSLTAAPMQDHFRVQSATEVPKNLVRIAWAGTFTMPKVRIAPLDNAVNPVGDKLFGWAESNEPWPLSFTPSIAHDSYEDRTGSGLMALLVLLPCLLISLVRFRERERFALALFAVGGVLVVSASLRYNVWISRFLLPSYLAAVPLAGLFLKRRVGRFAVLALVILGAFPMLFYTQQKPIVGSDVLTMYRADQMSLIEPDRAQVIRAVDREVPKGGRLGYIGSEDSWEYPYFGPHLDRKLVKLTTADVKPGIFELYDLDAFLVAAPVDPGLAAWLQTPIPGWRLAGDLLNKPNNETNPTPSFLFTPTEAP